MHCFFTSAAGCPIANRQKFNETNCEEGKMGNGEKGVNGGGSAALMAAAAVAASYGSSIGQQQSSLFAAAVANPLLQSFQQPNKKLRLDSSVVNKSGNLYKTTVCLRLSSIC